jgi:hypothetical protein
MAEVTLQGRTATHFGPARQPATARPIGPECGLEPPTPVVAEGTETTDERGRRLRWKDGQWWMLETVRIEDLADWRERLGLRSVGGGWPRGGRCPVVYYREPEDGWRH